MSYTVNALGIPSFIYEQQTPSDNWLIVHNLNKYVVIDVYIDYNGTRTKIIPQAIIFVNKNTVRVKFTSPRTGQALIA